MPLNLSLHLDSIEQVESKENRNLKPTVCFGCVPSLCSFPWHRSLYQQGQCCEVSRKKRSPGCKNPSPCQTRIAAEEILDRLFIFWRCAYLVRRMEQWNSMRCRQSASPLNMARPQWSLDRTLPPFSPPQRVSGGSLAPIRSPASSWRRQPGFAKSSPYPPAFAFHELDNPKPDPAASPNGSPNSTKGRFWLQPDLERVC